MSNQTLEPSQKRQLEGWIEDVREVEHSALKWATTLYRIKESGYWKATHNTWPEFCDEHFGYRKAMAYKYAALGEFCECNKDQVQEPEGEPRSLRQIEKIKKSITDGKTNLEYVGTETAKEEKMPARLDPYTQVEYAARVPVPQSAKPAAAPAHLIDRVSSLVREALRLQRTDRAFQQFVSHLLDFQKYVQGDLPGMGEHFSLHPSVKPKPVTAADIYAEYPLKVGKPVALAAIEKQMKETPAEKLLERTKLFASTRNGDLEFVPHPSTWFNQQRFNDDPATWKPKAAAPARNGAVDEKHWTEKAMDAQLARMRKESK